MSLIGQTGTAAFTAQEASSQAANQADPYGDVDFMRLLINEMQNQDPLDPMKNSEMVQQISQIREIGATDELTNTLGQLAANQDFVTASSLIGQKVTGLADDSGAVDGIVDRITVETDSENDSRSIKVHVGQQTMSIKNIREIQPG